MEITAEQFALVEHCLPKQRGNVSMTNLQVVNAMLYVAEHGCKWRGLPKRFGNWHTFCLSAGQAHDAPEGRKLLESLGPTSRPIHLFMDRAYEGNETRQLALDLGFIPVVPPLKTRIEPWEYDKEMYKRRNEVERLFRRLKGFRRIFSRFERLDAMFLDFLSFVLVVDGLRNLC
jgi:transposase